MSKLSFKDAVALRGANPLVLCVFAAGVLAAGQSGAFARDSLVVARPFEVGTSLSGNYLSAIVAHAERDTLAASTFFQEAMRGDPRNRELTERTLIDALANGDTQNAYPLAAKVLTFDRANAVALLTRAVEALTQRQYAKARTLLTKNAKRQGDIKDVLLTAWAYAGEKNERRALATLDQLRGEGYSVLRDYHAALIADQCGDKTEAERRFKTTVASGNTILRLIDAYGRFLSSRGDNEAAKKLYRAFNDAAPNNPFVLSALADLDAGRTLAPLIRDAQAGAGEALYGLVSLGNRQGDELAALIYLRLALVLAPDNMPATFTLAEIYEKQLRQDEQALAVYDGVPDGSPMRLYADALAGLTLESLGRAEDATKHLQAVVDAHPQNSEALTALADLQSQRKLYKEAVATYTRALALTQKPEKSQWGLYFHRGIANERAKNWPDAERDLRRALELNPDHPEILNYLGYSWVDQNMNLDEAFRMLRRAVDLDGSKGDYVDSLGWSYYHLGRYDEAVKELEKAIDLKPGDPIINDHLGDAYWRVGRKLEAKFQWNHARDLNREPEELPKILDKIKNGLVDAPTVAGEKQANKGG
ncbi:MAG TPA: tetratricopeptide repeat protein [Methylocystis sp.]|nr:tetratricopeptide repeat protein [Methylocystis sp.]